MPVLIPGPPPNPSAWPLANIAGSVYSFSNGDYNGGWINQVAMSNTYLAGAPIDVSFFQFGSPTPPNFCTVYDYDGNIVVAAAMTYTLNSVSGGQWGRWTIAPPSGGFKLGSYRVVLSGPVSIGGAFGTKYGTGFFNIVRNTPGFGYHGPGGTGFGGGGEGRDVSTKAYFGMGTSRLIISHAENINLASPGNNGPDSLQACRDDADRGLAWTPPDPARTWPLFASFPNGTVEGFVVGNFAKVYCKDASIDGSKVFVGAGPGTDTTKSKITVSYPNAGTLVETYDNLGTYPAAETAINAVSAYIHVFQYNTGPAVTQAPTAIGAAYRIGFLALVDDLFCHGVTLFEGPSNEPGLGTELAHQAKIFCGLVHTIPGAKAIGPSPVDILNLNGWNAFLNAGGGNYYDEIATHMYNTQGLSDFAQGRQSLEPWLDDLDRHGLADKVKWDTESVSPSMLQFGQYFPHNAQNMLLKILTREQYGMSRENNPPWYDRSHGFWNDATFFVSNCGVLPVAPMVRTLAEETWGMPLHHPLDFGSVLANHMFLGSIYKHVSDGTSCAVVQMNTKMPGASVTFKVLGTVPSSFTVIDRFGNSSTVAVVNGLVTMPVAATPNYMRIPAGTLVSVNNVNDWEIDPPPSVSARGHATFSGSTSAPGLIDGGYVTSYQGSYPGLIISTHAVPDTIEVMFNSTITTNRVLGTFDQGVPPTNFDVQTTSDNGATWTTRRSGMGSDALGYLSIPSSSVDLGTTDERPTDFQWTFDVGLGGTFSINGIRFVVHSLTYAGQPIQAHEISVTSYDTPVAFSGAQIVTAAPAVDPSYFNPRPIISGTAEIGGQLQAWQGHWTNTPTKYFHQWQKSTDGLTSWTDIAGAIRSDYAVVDSTVYYRCKKTASNVVGIGAAQFTDPVAPTGGSQILAPTNVGPPAVASALSAGFTLNTVLQKYPGNPTLTTTPGTFKSIDCAGGKIFWDAPNNRWGACYGGYDGTLWTVGLAYSDDLINWVDDPLNPVFGPNSNEGYIASNGSIIYKNGLYYMSYQAAIGGTIPPDYTKPFHFCLATSPDLHTWTRQNGGNPVMQLGAPGQYDFFNMFDQEVQLMADGVTFEMVYSAQSTSDFFGTRSFARAISSDNGFTWTKTGRLFTQAQIPSGGSGGDITSPTWWRDQNGWHMIFQASPRYDIYKIGHAISVDNGATWTFKYPILSPTTGFESVSVSNPNATVVGSRLYLTYAGGSLPGGNLNLNDQMALATADSPVTVVGTTLTANLGTWRNTPTSYSCQWEVSATGISGWSNATGAGATTASYVIAAADVGKYLRVTVTAANVAGSLSVSSSATTVVTQSAPSNVAPVISGVAQVGQTLATTVGTWQDGTIIDLLKTTATNRMSTVPDAYSYWVEPAATYNNTCYVRDGFWTQMGLTANRQAISKALLQRFAANINGSNLAPLYMLNTSGTITPGLYFQDDTNFNMLLWHAWHNSQFNELVLTTTQRDRLVTAILANLDANYYWKGQVYPTGGGIGPVGWLDSLETGLPLNNGNAYMQGLCYVALKSAKNLGSATISTAQLNGVLAAYQSFHTGGWIRTIFDRTAYTDPFGFVDVASIAPDFWAHYILGESLLTDIQVASHLDKLFATNVKQLPSGQGFACILNGDGSYTNRSFWKGFTPGDGSTQPQGGVYQNGGSWLLHDFLALAVGKLHGYTNNNVDRFWSSRVVAEMAVEARSHEQINTSLLGKFALGTCYPSSFDYGWNSAVALLEPFSGLVRT